MLVTPVLVVALVVLVPGFSGAVDVDRCELRDQLGSVVQTDSDSTTPMMREQALATVICEVLNLEVPPSNSTTATRQKRDVFGRFIWARSEEDSSQEDSNEGDSNEGDSNEGDSNEGHSSEEWTGDGGAMTNKTLADCVAVDGVNVTVDSVCVSQLFKSVCRDASAVCKNTSPNVFFQNCANYVPLTTTVRPTTTRPTQNNRGGGNRRGR